MRATRRIFLTFFCTFLSFSSIGIDCAIAGTNTPYIEVNVAARQLDLFDHKGEWIKTYPIAVGSPWHPTPIGTRYMNVMVWNPWWYPPKNSEWAKNDTDTPPGPHNPLGPVKMKLSSSIMIHGTNKPWSIGKAASHGCMRMYSEDAIELARWLQENSTKNYGQELFDKYKRYSRRSYPVRFENKIPVHITYELVDFDEETLSLNIYKDIYRTQRGEIQEQIELTLEEHGYKSKKINWDIVNKYVRKSRSKDMAIPIEELLLTSSKYSLKN